MPSMISKYDRQRRANLILAQRSRASLTEAQIDELVAAEVELQAPAPPAHQEDDGMMGATTTQLEVEISMHVQQIPTSFVHLLSPEVAPLVTFTVRNHRDRPARIKLVTRVEGFSADQIETFEVPAHEVERRSHLPVFHLDRLAAVTETRAASLYLSVMDLDAGKIEHEESRRVVLLPRTTAYLAVADASGGLVDLTRYLGAWVTPNAPEVMQLIREAAALHPSGSIVGYQSDHEDTLPAVVAAQVQAIYEALQARKLTYVNSVTAFGLTGDTFVQRIRLPREALVVGAANCIDGVVLMASLLEASSLNPAIVLIPGHAFLAYETSPTAGTWDYLETTLLGSASFADAREAGRRTTQAFERRHTSNLRLLKLAELRTMHGVFPME